MILRNSPRARLPPEGGFQGLDDAPVGRDTTDEWQGKPGPRRDIPKVFLGNLADDQPELKNYADQHPEIVGRLMRLHEQWAMDVRPK